MRDQSDKHGPRLDDEIGRETHGMVSGGHSTHAEEFKEAEPYSDDHPDDPAASAAAAGREGSPRGMSAQDVEGRSAVARMLAGLRYPARPNDLVRHASEGGAPDTAVQMLRALPKREYENLADVAEALGYGREEGRY